MIDPLIYTGGDLATNGYLLPVTDQFLCFDAPEGMADFIARQGLKVKALILTHGHFDHIWDAQRIANAHQCPVYAHPDDAFMITDTSVFKMFGVRDQIPPVKELKTITIPKKGKAAFEAGEENFTAYHIPGHSLGSVAFYHPGWELVMGGDILFAGGVGRWDLPGGSRDTLLAGIKKHLLTLPPQTRVYPGHGEDTTTGAEKETNPYLADDFVE